MKALVTGGAGFIGSHLSELLLAEGCEVFALDDLSTGGMHNVAHLKERGDFHLVVDSILSSSVVNELVHKCDVVYHLAAAVGVRLIVEQPVHTMVTNVQGTENVLEHCARFGKRVLIASSSEIYGDHREERPLGEDDRRIYGPTTEKRWLYADSKAMDEHLAFAWHQERKLDAVIARLFNTVGPRQSGQYGMVIARFVERALAGRGLRARDRGHAAPGARDRQDRRGHRLDPDPQPRLDPEGRGRAQSRRPHRARGLRGWLGRPEAVAEGLRDLLTDGYAWLRQACPSGPGS